MLLVSSAAVVTAAAAAVAVAAAVAADIEFKFSSIQIQHGSYPIDKKYIAGNQQDGLLDVQSYDGWTIERRM